MMPPLSPSPPALTQERDVPWHAHALLAFFAVCTITLGLLSDGVHHDDDLTHFLMARWARFFPGYLLHIWGRPGFTIPMAAVAWIGSPAFGWHAARILSALITAASALVALRVARDLGVRKTWCVILFTYLQPLNFLLAATTLTENVAAFYLICAIRLLQINRPLLASTVFSLILLTRHETAALLPVWWLALAYQRSSWSRRIASGLLSLWAIALHQILFFVVFEEWPFKIFFEPRGSTEYLPAGWLSYLPHALYAITPLVAALAIAGAVQMWNKGGRLLVALVVVFFLTHVGITALGVFASGGYGRFMITISPILAILAAAGMDRFTQPAAARSGWYASVLVWLLGLVALEIEIHSGRIVVPPGVYLTSLRIVAMLMIALSLIAAWTTQSILRRASTTVLVVVTIVQFAAIVHPLRLGPGQLLARQTADWIQQNKPDSPIFSTDPWLSHFLGLSENPRAHKGARLLASMPVGSLFIWDSRYSPNDFHGLKLERYRDDPAYTLIHEFTGPSASHGLRMVLLEKQQETAIPPETPQYPPNLLTRHAPIMGIYYIRSTRH
jgi:hypothetical protein